MVKTPRLVFFLLGLLAASPSLAQSDGFGAWLQAFAREAAAQGVSGATLQRVLPQLSYDDSVIELDRRQPESRLSLEAYLRGALVASRIEKGRELMGEHAAILAQAEAATGVPRAVIVALWAVESSYGANTGDYDVLSSLATLAYEGRRADFFRKELIEALRIVDEGMDPFLLRGSWAGAMGQSQFMPSTYRRFAVDANGDGRRDIWDDPEDVLASIGNYLAFEGWQRGQSWGQEVRLTRPLSASEIGLETAKSLEDWKARGVRALNGRNFEGFSASVSLIRPDGPGGRAFLVYDNFRALMRWNRSTYFATSVGLLADQLADGR